MPIKKPSTDKPNLKRGGSTPYSARTITNFSPLTPRNPLRKNPLPPHPGNKWGHFADLADNLADSVDTYVNKLDREKKAQLQQSRNRTLNYIDERVTREGQDLFSGKTSIRKIRNSDSFVNDYAERYGIDPDQAKEELDHHFRSWGGLDYGKITSNVYKQNAAAFNGAVTEFSLPENIRKRARKYVGREAEKELFANMNMALMKRELDKLMTDAMAGQKEIYLGEYNKATKFLLDKGVINKSQAVELNKQGGNHFFDSIKKSNDMRNEISERKLQQAYINETGLTSRDANTRSQRQIVKNMQEITNRIFKGRSTPNEEFISAFNLHNTALNRGENIALKNTVLNKISSMSDMAIRNVFAAKIPPGAPKEKILRSNTLIRNPEAIYFAEKLVQHQARLNPNQPYDQLSQSAGASLDGVITQAGLNKTLGEFQKELPLVNAIRIMQQNPSLGKQSPNGILSADSLINAYTSPERAEKYRQQVTEYLTPLQGRDKQTMDLKRNLQQLGFFAPKPVEVKPKPSRWERFKTWVGEINPLKKDDSGNKKQSKGKSTETKK